MHAKVTHSIGDLSRDLTRIAAQAPKDMRSTVNRVGREGNRIAKANAVVSSRAHAKLYPGTFTVDVSGFLGFGGGQFTAEYGPEARGQGYLASYLEEGTRNNPPHHDLTRSLDVIKPKFHHDVSEMVDGWFW